MRRITSLLASFGLLASVGCSHVAGFCDCKPPVTPCAIYGLYPAGDYSSQPVVAAAATNAVVEPPKADITKPITPPTGRE